MGAELRTQRARRAGAAGRAGLSHRPRDPRGAHPRRGVPPGERTPHQPRGVRRLPRGRYFFNRPSDENLQKAIARFEEAIALEPGFAPAHSGLSDAYLWAGYNEGFLTASEARPRAKAAAEKAIELDAASAEAHTSLANFKLWYEYDWKGSEAAFRRALELNPSYAYARDQFGMGLAFQGRLEEAIAEGKRAAELDPLSPQIPLDATLAFVWKGEYGASRQLVGRASELDPTYFMGPFMAGWIELQAGRVEDAVAQLQKAEAMGAPAFVSAWLAYAHGASGDRARAAAGLDALKEKSLRGTPTAFNLALVHLGLGDHARALSELERAQRPTRSGSAGSDSTGRSTPCARSPASQSSSGRSAWKACATERAADRPDPRPRPHHRRDRLPAGPSARAAQAASLLYSQAKTAPPMTPSTKPQTRPTSAPA